MMTSQPLVSVVIPTYNRAGIIAKAIDNVFEQTYRNIEVIVVDDGSTDDTIAVLRSYGGRLRFARQKNAGPAAARNRGISMARGEIVAFQDSDDAWRPSKIERQVSLLQRAGDRVTCCICNTDIYTSDGRVFGAFSNAGIDPLCEEGVWTNVAEVLSTTFIIFCQAAAIWRSALNKIGGFDERLEYLEDYELPLRLAIEGPWAVIRSSLAMQKQGTPNSFSQGAFRRPVLLAECEVRLREAVLQRLPLNGATSNVRAQMERDLRKAKRYLKATELRRSKLRLAAHAGNCWLALERYRSAVERRLPGYPKIQIRSLPLASRPAAEGTIASHSTRGGVRQ